MPVTPLTLSIVLDANNKGLVTNVRVSKKELDKFNKSVDGSGVSAGRARDKMGRFVKQTKDVDVTSRRAGKSVRSLTSGFGGLAGMLAGIGIGVVVRELAMGIDTMQGMEAQLKTITGDWESANVELERLIGFAKQTPYDLNQSVEAFAKLTHLGLNPSERAMMSYGNTASAMGKDLMQMIEAVADASVGEFERLKEFGIKASQQGDKVRLTFQGNTTEIGKDAASIQEYLLAIGENQFAGAMEDQMTRLGAKYSNFKMEVLQLTDALGDAGLTAIMGGIVDGGAEMVAMFTDIVRSGVVLDELGIWADQFHTTFNLILDDLGLSREQLDDVAGDGIDGLKAVFDFWLSGMREIGDFMKNYPANLRTVWHIIIGESEIAWEKLKTGSINLGSHINEGWQKISHAADGAWSWVELQFAGMMDGILLTMASGLTSLAGSISSLPGMEDVSSSILAGAESLTSMADAQTQVKYEMELANIEHQTTIALIAEKRHLSAADSQASINEINQRIAKVIEERNAMIAVSNAKRAAAKKERDAKKKSKTSKSRKSVSNDVSDFKYDDSGMKKLIADVDKLGGAWGSTGDVMTRAFGTMADNINALSKSQDDYNKLQDVMGVERKKIMKIDDLGERQEQLKKLDKVETDVSDARLSNTLGSFSSITGAAAQMFDEQSKGREALHKMEQAFTIIEVGLAMQKAGANAISAITAAFEAPWPIGFASGAAMIAIMAGLGVFSGSSGVAPPSAASRQESQGTGTVLGSDDKSASIENSYSRIEDLELDQYAELQTMNAQLRDLNNNITHLATSLVVQYGQFNGEAYDGFLGSKSNSDTGGFFAKNGSKLFGSSIGGSIGGIVDSVIGSFSKTKVSLLDSGLAFGKQNLGRVYQTGETDLWAYNDIKTKKSSFWGLSSKTKYSTDFKAVNSDIENEVGRIFMNIGDSAMSAVELLGLDVANSLNTFMIDLPRLSFKDLSGDEIQKELEAVFSQQSDLIAQWLAPSMKEYQQIGEGLYDTLIRVSQEQAVFNAALEQSGLALSRFGDVSAEAQIAISQSIIELSGGIESFKESTNTYFSEFFSEQEQFDFLASQLATQFENLGQRVPANEAQFKALVESLNLTTDSGQRTYAALMRLVPAAAEYYDQLEQQADKVKQLTSDIGSTLDQILGGTALSDLIAAEERRMQEQQAGADALYRTEMQRYDQSIAAQKSLMDYLNGLQLGELSTLTPEQQLAEAKAQFSTVLAAAKGGDIDAANSATGIASSYLSIARDFYASSDAYSDIFVDVNNQLGSIADVMGNVVAPNETELGESDELKRLKAELDIANAAKEVANNEALANTLADQLAALSLAKDESISSLITSMGIDLDEVATALGLDIESVVTKLGLEFKSLNEIVGISNADLAKALGVDLETLASTLGISITELNTSFDGSMKDIADAFGIDIATVVSALGLESKSLTEIISISNVELAKALGVDLETFASTLGLGLTELNTSFNGSVKDISDAFGVDIATVVSALDLEFKSLNEIVGISNADLARVLGVDLETLASTLGINITELNTSFDGSMKDIADAFGVDITSLADALGVDLNTLIESNKAGLDGVRNAVDGMDINVGISAPPLPPVWLPPPITNPQTGLPEQIPLMVDELSALRTEVQLMREDNALFAQQAELSRIKQVNYAQKTVSSLKAPIDTRRLA